MTEIKLLPDWPENRWKDYYDKALAQLGELWSLSEDATVANCGNIQLLWSPTKWTWFLESDGVEIGRFLLPFEEKSLTHFQRLCSYNYRSE